MAPPSADIDTYTGTYNKSPIHQTNDSQETNASLFYSPLNYSGSLDNYEHFDITAVIGREFPKLQLSGILNDDTKIQDLAITGDNFHNIQFHASILLTVNLTTVSQRGVVFFRKQDLTTYEMKILAQKLGLLTGKPRNSGVSVFKIWLCKACHSLILLL